MVTGIDEGLLTFAFTDIVGSTRLWERAPAAMRTALARHNAIAEEIVRTHGGSVFKTVGDACCCVFADAADAVRAAIALQRALTNESWHAEIGRVQVRIGIHSGTAVAENGDYFGPTLNRVARLVSAGHGGQILLSADTVQLIGDELAGVCVLEDVGAHRLKDLAEPQHLYQVLAYGLAESFPAPASLDARPNNLPSLISEFVGREREMAELRGLLSGNRLVTICGSGGSGKTRLALQLAADTIGHYKDGSWFVRLTDIEEPKLVANALASALHVAEVPGEDMSKTLAERLQNHNLFIVLDNAEHVLDATAELVRTLLSRCPGAAILVTSREPLHLAGERVLRLGPLMRDDAAQLFLSRSNLSAIDRYVPDICDRLDGLPLAIEIAAVRIGTLNTKQLSERLKALMPSLASKDASQEARHRTLHATIDWSYRLLSAPERRLFEVLSVFEGNFDLEACEALSGDGSGEDGTYELLDALVDKSFVTAEPRDDTMRYRLLETLRDYASEKLRHSGEAPAVWQRHFEYFKAFAERASVPEIETELPNLRAALEWGFSCKDRSAACELLLRVALYWQQHCNVAEGRAWLSRACDDPAGIPALMQAKLLRRAATFATIEDDYPAARALTAKALERFRELDDRAGSAEALHNLAVIEDRSGSPAEAQRLYRQALQEFEQTGHTVGIITALYNLAQTHKRDGDYAAARALLERGMALCSGPEHADRRASFARSFGEVALRQGALDEAAQALEHALALKRALQNRYDEVESLHTLAALYARRTDWETAERYTVDALRLARELAAPALIIGCFELFAVIFNATGREQQARRIIALAKAMRSERGYVFNLVDELAEQLEALSDAAPLPDAAPEDVARAIDDLLTN